MKEMLLAQIMLHEQQTPGMHAERDVLIEELMRVLRADIERLLPAMAGG